MFDSWNFNGRPVADGLVGRLVDVGGKLSVPIGTTAHGLENRQRNYFKLNPCLQKSSKDPSSPLSVLIFLPPPPLPSSPPSSPPSSFSKGEEAARAASVRWVSNDRVGIGAAGAGVTADADDDGVEVFLELDEDDDKEHHIIEVVFGEGRSKRRRDKETKRRREEEKRLFEKRHTVLSTVQSTSYEKLTR